MYEAEKTQRFYDAYAGLEWSRLEATAYGRLQAIIHTDVIERYVRRGDRVLDVGCGPGRFAVEIARLGGRTTLVDISGRQLALARETMRSANVLESVDGFVQADVARLAILPSASFDVVVCFGGALSYVCEERQVAADELARVTRPGGTLLVSVMSRYGAAANIVRRPFAGILKEPERWHLWDIVRTGDLPPFPSQLADLLHPAMHMYTAAELAALFGQCDILELAGSNVSTYEGAPQFEELAADDDAWAAAVRLERELCRAPGLVESGSHMIIAARKR